MISFLKNMFGNKSVETRTQSQEITHKYQTGQLKSKKTIESVTEGNNEAKVTYYSEFYDKSGDIYLKYKQLNSESSPVIWEIQKLSGRTAFADEEEKDTISGIFELIKQTDQEYAKTIDFKISWILYTSPLGYYAEFPGMPESTTRKSGEEITVYESTFAGSDRNYTISLIYNAEAAKNDQSFYNFFMQVTQLNDSMKMVSEKVVNIVGIDTALRKVEIINGGKKFYVTLIQFGIQYHVVSISINSQSSFVNDAEFERFYKGFGLVKAETNTKAEAKPERTDASPIRTEQKPIREEVSPVKTETNPVKTESKEIKDFALEKFLVASNYEKNKEIMKKIAYLVLEKVGANKDDIKITNHSKRNDSSETGPGGRYQIYDYSETYHLVANQMGFRVECTDYMHEANDVSWSGVFCLTSYDFPDKIFLSIKMQDRRDFKISGKLPNDIIELISEKLSELK